MVVLTVHPSSYTQSTIAIEAVGIAHKSNSLCFCRKNRTITQPTMKLISIAASLASTFAPSLASLSGISLVAVSSIHGVSARLVSSSDIHESIKKSTSFDFNNHNMVNTELQVPSITSEEEWTALMEQSKEKTVVVDFTATWYVVSIFIYSWGCGFQANWNCRCRFFFILNT